eukprot:TRINITY_DN7537_c0_g1_i1.p1 TRINITY_DN7537_c0_g1~~TRINITY_DN7537_c0_g1_i1.p1  ORF type:complete len:243 (+),score=48.14 TRINITY_DN7537_c0_g1_i1:132-860(+)
MCIRDSVCSALRANNEVLWSRTEDLTGWTERNSGVPGVQLYVDDSGFLGCPHPAVLVRAEISGAPSQVHGCLYTVAPGGFDRTVRTVNDQVDVQTVQFDPPLMSIREACVARCAVSLSDGTVMHSLTSVEFPGFDFLAGATPLLIHAGGFVMTELRPGETLVSLLLAMDPQGMIPSWLVSLGLSKLGKYMGRLKRHVESARDVDNLSLIHISEPTRLLSISYAVFCLKKKKKTTRNHTTTYM